MKSLERTVERITPSSRWLRVVFYFGPANAVFVDGVMMASN
ncbi:hypothetical protein [Pararhizobium sp. LjRoot238]